MAKTRRKSSADNRSFASREYELLQQKALSDRIRRALQGRLSPTRQQVIDKLNRERKEHEEGLERNHGK